MYANGDFSFANFSRSPIREEICPCLRRIESHSLFNNKKKDFINNWDRNVL